MRSPVGICWRTSVVALLVLGEVARSSWASPPPVPAKPAPAITAGPPTKPAQPVVVPPAASAPRDSDVQIRCDDDPDCGEAVQRALNQSDAKDYEAALRTYQAIYQRWPTPWLLINLGRVQQKSGLPAEAVVTYERYLDTAANDKPERLKVARAFLAQAKQEIEVQRYKQMLAEAKAKERPNYKKWWFWVAIGGTVAAVAAITAGVVLGTRSPIAPERMPGANNFVFQF